MKRVWLAMTVILCAHPVMAQLQLRALDGLAAKAKESTEINLDAATLQLAGGFLGDGKGMDPKVRKLLEGVRSIVIRTYEFSKRSEYDPAVVRDLQEQLRAQGWSKFLDFSDREDGESFQLYSKTEDGKSKGFAMVAAEPKELAVIYIEGPLSLSDLGSLSGQFGIPKIPGPKQEKNKNGKE
jgi:hypothetical protein